MKRIPELDGLRGVAALVVVISHFFGEVPHGYKILTFGWLGVNVFFVLSGFLIGSIILDQQSQPHFIKSFYLRRAARIVPVYAVVCAVTLLLAGVLSDRSWSDHPFSPLVYAVFGTNVAMSVWDGGGEWLRPTWTLAVEEQFYLFLPVLVLVTPKRLLMPTLMALWAAATLFRAAMCEGNPLAAFSLLPARMDLLLAGVMAAYINRRFDLSGHLRAIRAGLPVMMALLIGVVVLSPYRFFIIFSPTLSSLGIACFLVAIVNGAPEGTRYRSPTLGYVGRISYALYLVHQPVAGVLHGMLLGGTPDINSLSEVAVTLLAILVSVALAAVSWIWLEAPILRRARARNPTPTQRADRRTGAQAGLAPVDACSNLPVLS